MTKPVHKTKAVNRKHLQRRNRRRRHAYAPTRNTAGHGNMRKTIHGFPLFPYMGIGLRLGAFGPPELRYQTNIMANPQSGTVSRLNMNLEPLVFVERGKLESLEKILGARTTTNHTV